MKKNKSKNKSVDPKISTVQPTEFHRGQISTGPQVHSPDMMPPAPLRRNSERPWSGELVDSSQPQGGTVDYETGTLANIKKIRVSGLDGRAETVNESTGFCINISGAGSGELVVNIRDPDAKKVRTNIERVAQGTYQVMYKPVITGNHTIFVMFKGMNILGSPFKVMVTDNPGYHGGSIIGVQTQSRSGYPQIFNTVTHVSDEAPYKRRPSLPNIMVGGMSAAAPFVTPELTEYGEYVDVDGQGFRTPTNVLDSEAFLQTLPLAIRAKLEPCLRKVASFDVGKDIGQGQFGVVKETRYAEENQGCMIVAAKKLKDCHRKYMEDFLQEPILMKMLKHENVLELIAVVIYCGSPYIVMPLMKWGSLKDYIKRQGQVLRGDHLMSFCLQISKGMDYISSLKIVHRDLAARNCMLDGQSVVKIADFGLARDTIKDPYVMLVREKNLPIRWMAPEIIKSLAFSTETDVWAYGVTVWEIFTFGDWPYEGVHDRVLFQFLADGQRLEKPDMVPDDMYQLMLRCWEDDPNQRPDFAEIHKRLSEIADEGVVGEIPEYDVTYVEPIRST